MQEAKQRELAVALLAELSDHGIRVATYDALSPA